MNLRTELERGVCLVGGFFVFLGLCAAFLAPAQPPDGARDLRELMAHVSFVDMPDGNGGTVRTLRLSGINVQIVNGMGATETTNGAGNLIVGYNEYEPFGDYSRSGSHNIVGGISAEYWSYGGLVVGKENVIAGPYCTVTGGEHNGASFYVDSVTGGYFNEARGGGSVVSGGYFRQATNQDNWAAGSLHEDQ